MNKSINVLFILVGMIPTSSLFSAYTLENPVQGLPSPYKTEEAAPIFNDALIGPFPLNIQIPQIDYTISNNNTALPILEDTPTLQEKVVKNVLTLLKTNKEVWENIHTRIDYKIFSEATLPQNIYGKVTPTPRSLLTYFTQRKNEGIVAFYRINPTTQAHDFIKKEPVVGPLTHTDTITHTLLASSIFLLARHCLLPR